MAEIPLRFNNLLLVEYDEYLLKKNKSKIIKILRQLIIIFYYTIVIKPLDYVPQDNRDDYLLDNVIANILNDSIRLNNVNFSGRSVNVDIDGYNVFLSLSITRCDYKEDWQQLCNFIKYSILTGGYIATGKNISEEVKGYIESFRFNIDARHYPKKPVTLEDIGDIKEGEYKKIDEISNLEFDDDVSNYKKFLRDFLIMFIDIDKLVTYKIAKKVYDNSSNISDIIPDKSKIDEKTALMIKYFISIIFDLIIISLIIFLYDTKLPTYIIDVFDIKDFGFIEIFSLYSNIDLGNEDNIFNIFNKLCDILHKCKNIQKAPICDLTDDYKELMKSKRLKPVFCGILKGLINPELNQFKMQLGGNSRKIIKVLKKYRYKDLDMIV